MIEQIFGAVGGVPPDRLQKFAAAARAGPQNGRAAAPCSGCTLAVAWLIDLNDGWPFGLFGTAHACKYQEKCRQPRPERKPVEKCDSRITRLATIGLDADVGHLHLALSLFARLEAFNRRIPTPPQGDVDPLQHDVMDF